MKKGKYVRLLLTSLLILNLCFSAFAFAKTITLNNLTVSQNNNRYYVQNRVEVESVPLNVEDSPNDPAKAWGALIGRIFWIGVAIFVIWHIVRSFM